MRNYCKYAIDSHRATVGMLLRSIGQASEEGKAEVVIELSKRLRHYYKLLKNAEEKEERE